MDVFNLARGELSEAHDRPGFRWRGVGVGEALAAEQIGGSIYELAAGEQVCPYHYHHGVEEWLVVVDGTPTLRTPDGERELARGDVVCFTIGPAGAHAVRGPGRVLILSANRRPSICVYPDSDKIGTRPDDDDDLLNFPRAAAVDYWEGE